eukprot:755326-Hanusia_phi.AAC.3
MVLVLELLVDACKAPVTVSLPHHVMDLLEDGQRVVHVLDRLRVPRPALAHEDVSGQHEPHASLALPLQELRVRHVSEGRGITEVADRRRVLGEVEAALTQQLLGERHADEVVPALEDRQGLLDVFSSSRESAGQPPVALDVSELLDAEVDGAKRSKHVACCSLELTSQHLEHRDPVLVVHLPVRLEAVLQVLAARLEVSGEQLNLPERRQTVSLSDGGAEVRVLQVLHRRVQRSDHELDLAGQTEAASKTGRPLDCAVVQAPLRDHGGGDFVLADGLEEEAGGGAGVEGFRQAVERCQDRCEVIGNLADALDHLGVGAADVCTEHDLRVRAREDVGLYHGEHRDCSGAVVVLYVLQDFLGMALQQRKHELEVSPALLGKRLVHNVHHRGNACSQLEDGVSTRNCLHQGAGGAVEPDDLDELEGIDQPTKNLLGLMHQRSDVSVQNSSWEVDEEPYKVVCSLEVGRCVPEGHLHPCTQTQRRAIHRAVQVEDDSGPVRPGVGVDQTRSRVLHIDLLQRRDHVLYLGRTDLLGDERGCQPGSEGVPVEVIADYLR